MTTPTVQTTSPPTALTDSNNPCPRRKGLQIDVTGHRNRALKHKDRQGGNHRPPAEHADKTGHRQPVHQGFQRQWIKITQAAGLHRQSILDRAHDPQWRGAKEHRAGVQAVAEAMGIGGPDGLDHTAGGLAQPVGEFLQPQQFPEQVAEKDGAQAMTICLTAWPKVPLTLNQVSRSPKNMVSTPRLILKKPWVAAESGRVRSSPKLPPRRMPAALRMAPITRRLNHFARALRSAKFNLFNNFLCSRGVVAMLPPIAGVNTKSHPNLPNTGH